MCVGRCLYVCLSLKGVDLCLKRRRKTVRGRLGGSAEVEYDFDSLQVPSTLGLLGLGLGLWLTDTIVLLEGDLV